MKYDSLSSPAIRFPYRFACSSAALRPVVVPLSIFLLLVAFSLLTDVASATVSTTLPFPPRPPGAMTGSEFYNYVQNMTIAQREDAVWQEVVSGNVPDFLRSLVPITVSATINGVYHTATYYVAPDYVSIGSDVDFFRMPVSAPLAQKIADLAYCNLPTRKMVDAIYTNAAVKLAPYPFSPTYYDIMSIDVFWASNQHIEQQRAGNQLGLLVGGIKKDIVVTPQLPTRPPPPRVAIYGWHQLDGTPIQPLSLVHEETYMDYSHGVRLVNEAMLVDGAETTVKAVLADPNLAALLSDEGAFTDGNHYPAPAPVTNGSFEDGFTNGVGTGWTAWTGSGSAALTFGTASINKIDGNYSQYWKRGDTSAIEGGIYQQIAVEPGYKYSVSGWIKRQCTFDGAFLQFGYDLSGGTDPDAASTVYSDLTASTDNVWQNYSAEAVATGDTITLFIRSGHTGTTGGTNAYFYADAISATCLGYGIVSTPTPSPTPSPTTSPSPTPVIDASLVENFEGYSVSSGVMLRSPAFSGSTTGIVSGSSSAVVSTAEANDALDPRVGTPGSQSDRVAWTWSTAGSGFVRCTTWNNPIRPNPIIDLTKGLSIYVKVGQGEVDCSIWVRETGVSGAIGGDGGTSGDIEEVSTYRRLTASPDWQYLYFDLPNESYSPIAGNGVLNGTWGTLEALVFKAVSGSSSTNVEIYIDDVYVGEEQTPGGSSTPTPTPSPSATPTLTPSPSPTPYAGNVVVNPSFEDGFTGGIATGWTAWQADGSNSIIYGQASINKHDGSYSQYWARNDTAPFDGGVYQIVDVTPGATYHITAWIKFQSAFAGTILKFGYDLSGGTDGAAASVVYQGLESAGNNVWTQADLTVTATGDTITLFARGGHTSTSGGTNCYLYLDEVACLYAP